MVNVGWIKRSESNRFWHKCWFVAARLNPTYIPPTNRDNSMKLRTTIRLPKAVQLEMQHKIIDDGYGLRGKSRWVAEAIESLLELGNYHELVDIADEMSDLTQTEVIMVQESLKTKLEAALINVRQHYPELEGVQSRIIRSSIMQRLIRT